MKTIFVKVFGGKGCLVGDGPEWVEFGPSGQCFAEGDPGKIHAHFTPASAGRILEWEDRDRPVTMAQIGERLVRPHGWDRWRWKAEIEAELSKS